MYRLKARAQAVLEQPRADGRSRALPTFTYVPPEDRSNAPE
jgi:hypothetical protein